MRFATFRLLLTLILFVPPAWAENVALVLSGNDTPYTEFTSSLRDAIAGTTWKIAVGTNAFRQTLAHSGNTPVIATLLPRLAYEKLLAESGNRTRRVSAIWLDQPAARQAAFIRHLLPGKSRIGMLISSENHLQVGPFRQAFTSAGLTLETEESDSDKALLSTLNALLARVNIVLAIPDSGIYKRDSIRSILMTTYRYQRPVVAFSPALVNAGALAALYSTPTQIARQTAEVMHTFNSTLPPPMSPNQFSIMINQNVALALDLNIRDEADIRRALLADKEAR